MMLPLRAFSRVLVLALLAAAAARAADNLTEASLPARTRPAGPTLFTLLSPAQTGIVTENNYADPRMWAEKYQEFALGSIGTGLAIGDYDNDGRPDLLVVSKTEGCRLFRNLGGWKFEDVSESSGMRTKPVATVTTWRQGATFVDVNNDGLLDIYICRYEAHNLLFINQGNGTFKEESEARGLAVKDASGMGAFCDYDRDGWLDVYVQTNMLDSAAHPGGQRGYLFHNNGNGTFTNVTDRAGIGGESLSHSATWWDYDNDGWPDLYVANDFAGADRLYHNNRDGTFTDTLNQVVPRTPYSSMGADFGDVDNDGRIDLFVADMAATTHEKDQRGMASSRELSREDSDSPTLAPQFPANTLFLNTGTARTLEAAHLAGLAATDWTWSVRLEDLDNDGRLDLFVTNGMNREYQNADLRQKIILAENMSERMRLMKMSAKLEERHLAFRNLGDLNFEEVGAKWGLDQKGVSFGAAFGDFDGDGNLDLVYANYEGGVTVLRNDGATGHRIVVALRGVQSNRFGVGATVRIETASGRQVRQLVLSRGYLSSSEPVLHFGLGEDAAIKSLHVSWPSGQEQTFTNLGVDRRFTITESSTPGVKPGLPPPPPAGQFTEVSAAANLGFVAREPASHEPDAQRLIPTRFNNRGPAVAIGDLNGDGQEDVLLGGTAADPARVLLHDAKGFTAAAGADLPGNGLDDGPALLFDANGDGFNDVLITKGGTGQRTGSPEYQPKLYLNDGHGGLTPSDALPPLPVSVGAAAAADFDHDGKLDLFIGGRVQPGRYPLPPRSALLVNRGGKFEDVTEALAPGLKDAGMVSSALWSDADGDGWPDLFVALEWGSVKYFHNNQGHGFEDWTERAGFAAAGTGWWTSLASADFNGDGKPDYVAGNVGLNTQYHASPEHPALLFQGAFGSGPSTQLIEAYYEGDKLYPWRTRKELGSWIPAINQRFPRNDLYARATLGEILGEEKLKSARKFAATELRSGVFLSQPDGTYRFEPLPRIAQIAPLQGIVTGDFDGDGETDIYAVQNSFAPIPAVGRFDGGISQLLRGDGHGHFTAVPPGESGLVVPGDAKGLAAIDLDSDGWTDFIVTRNNASTLAFRNRGVAGHHPLRVLLRGPAGNPSAIGATLTLELANGSMETAEIQAGSGYYSQSSPAAIFGYPDGNPPRKISIRWPNGATSTQALASPPATITIVQ